jgi:hypothetical protein
MLLLRLRPQNDFDDFDLMTSPVWQPFFFSIFAGFLGPPVFGTADASLDYRY